MIQSNVMSHHAQKQMTSPAFYNNQVITAKNLMSDSQSAQRAVAEKLGSHSGSILARSGGEEKKPAAAP